MEQLVVVNLNDIAHRWEIPVERIQYFIVECGLLVNLPEEEWFASHSELILKEKQAYVELLLFPRKLRPEPSKTPAWPSLLLPSHVAVETNHVASGYLFDNGIDRITLSCHLGDIHFFPFYMVES